MVALMNCPRDKTPLKVRTHRGIEVDECPACKGMWLDHHELDDLEDRAFDSGHRKGTRIYAQRESDISCVKCGKLMTTFNYRAYNLPIDQCPDQHGYWLDPGEEKQVMDLMKRRVRDLNRSATAQVGWDKTVRRGGGRSLTDRIKDFFR